MELLVFAVALLAAPAAYAAAVHSTLEDLGGSSDYKQSSPFLKVIKTTDIADHDAIYYTPPVYFVGENTGNILRCLQEDRNTCEVFYKGSGGIYDLLVHMEHLYAADGKTLVKCESHNARACRTIFTCDEHIFALEIDDSNLYMGLYNGTILLCQLTEPTTCRIFHTLDMITSLKQIDSHIYAGLKNGQIMRCSLFADNKCTPVYNATGTFVFGLTKFGNNIIGVTHINSRWWSCSLGDDTTDCESAELNFHPLDVAWFNSNIYVLETEKTIHTCKWGNELICSEYAHQGGWSMAFIYGTYRLQSRYADEQRACPWQSGSKCPPFVAYYGAQPRATFKVHVKDGKLYNSVGDLVDTSAADVGYSGPAAIFVMAPDGTLLLSNSHKKELLHTSSLLAGYPVSAAGEIVVEQGVIKNITACSRHYYPDVTLNHQLVDSLRSQGYTGAFDSEPCCAYNICDDNDYDASMDKLDNPFDAQTLLSAMRRRRAENKLARRLVQRLAQSFARSSVPDNNNLNEEFEGNEW